MAAGKTVAIHQPNFLPWLGYFDKIARADAFVLLDDAQHQKKGGTYSNRVKMLVSGEPAWVTVPIDRSYSGVREIREIEIDNSRPWRRKTLKTIEESYRRAPELERVLPVLRELIEAPTTNLADYNELAIRRLAGELGIETEIVLASSLGATSAGTERLIELTRAAGGSAYLSGGGAGGYQDEAAFEGSGVELQEQAFEHPAYPQLVEPFVEGLSAVDALLSCGFEGTRRLLG